jgi:hypothetical protein
MVSDPVGYRRAYGAPSFPRVFMVSYRFNDGYTAVQGLTRFDVNGDGFQDLLLAHQRNDDGPVGVLPTTSRASSRS